MKTVENNIKELEIPKTIKVFQTKSRDNKYTFWKSKIGDKWADIKFDTKHRPNFTPVFCDTTDAEIDNGEYLNIKIKSDNFTAPYYNTETKEVEYL